MKEELYNKIDKFCNETDWSKYPTYEHALEDFIKGIVAEETKELEKENAELKEEKRINKWADLKGGLKVVYKKNLEMYDQLTKAIEILKKYHKECPSKYSFEDIDDMAEQFLSEVEK